MPDTSNFIVRNLPEVKMKTMTKKTIIILSKTPIVAIVFRTKTPKNEKNTPNKVTIIGTIQVCDNLSIFAFSGSCGSKSISISFPYCITPLTLLRTRYSIPDTGCLNRNTGNEDEVLSPSS